MVPRERPCRSTAPELIFIRVRITHHATVLRNFSEAGSRQYAPRIYPGHSPVPAVAPQAAFSMIHP